MKDFDISQINIPFSMLQIASRSSGKSVSTKHFLAQSGGLIDRFDLIYIFCPSHQVDFYVSVIPADHIFIGMDEFEDKLEIITFKQNEMMEKKGMNLDILFVLDDLLSYKGKRNQVLLDAFGNVFRHSNISCVISIQRISYCRELLTNTTHLQIFPHRGFLQSDKKYIAEEIIIGYVENKEEAYKLLNSFQQYEALVIDMFANSDEALFKFKADSKFINYSIKNISDNNIEEEDDTL